MFRDHIRCTRAMIELRCGPEAADLADDIITKATARLVHPYCADLPIGDGRCSSGYSIGGHAVLIAMLLGVLAVMQIRP